MKYVLVTQRGRLEAEAVLLTASLVTHGKIDPQNITVCYPIDNDLWRGNPTPREGTLAILRSLGATLVPFDNSHFGSTYPQANKIYAVAAMNADYVTFLDTDIFCANPLEFFQESECFVAKSASKTFPNPKSKTDPQRVWHSVYELLNLDAEAHLALPYYNAGVIGIKNPKEFGQTWLKAAITIYESKLQILEDQRTLPYLDQIALPVALRLVEGTVREPEPSVNASYPRDDTALWHYHYIANLMLEGRRVFGSKIDDLLDRDEINAVFQGDKQFSYWRTSEAEALARSVLAEGETLLNGANLQELVRLGAPNRRGRFKTS